MAFGDWTAPSHSKVGQLTSEHYDGGAPVIRELVRCIHCDYRWVWIPGSGRRRGYCLSCQGITCGQAHCDAAGCVHWAQRIENAEAGRPDTYKPIRAAVPSLSGIILGR